MKKPTKPFPNYKWRWATLTCTEGLNEPPVFMGILRALREFEGYRPNDSNLFLLLKKIEEQTRTNVTLARDANRNIIRNSGQYWKAVNVLEDTRPGIKLTKFGRKFADGKITPVEFAFTVINKLELPNNRIEQNAQEWGGLKIKPLQLILNILAELNQTQGEAEAYITPFELYRIIIPLAGDKSETVRHVSAIILFRSGELDLADWPNCSPSSNDKRMAREFLLFLYHYGLCTLNPSGSRDDEKYYLSSIEPHEIGELNAIDTADLSLDDAFDKIRKSELPASSERRRVLISALSRPQQAVFRENVLNAFNTTCIVTQITLPSTLEAAHIIPVSSDGADAIDNSLCLRTDIHRLYDSGHLRIKPNGILRLSEKAVREENYGNLPEKIDLPLFVSMDCIEWRWNYG